MQLLLLALLLSLLLFACALPFTKTSVEKQQQQEYKALKKSMLLSKASIISSANSNNGFPTPIDFVFVYDADVAGIVLPTNASDWFNKRHLYRYKYQKELSIVSYEIVESSLFRDIDITAALKKGALKVMAYIDYSKSPLKSKYAVNISTIKQLRIELLPDKFLIKDLANKAK